MTIFRRAEGGLGTEGWGPAFLSVLSQTRELPDNYHFLVIGTTNRVIHMCSKVTFLLSITYLSTSLSGWGHSKPNQIKAMMPLIADIANECAITF